MIRDILERSAREMKLTLSSENLNSFRMFTDELNKWNSRLNLTAITSDEEIAIKHFADSLHLAQFVSDEDDLLDMGSGAGLPIIPLKIVRPDTIMLSVDAVAKKVNFQRHVIRVLGLKRIKVLHARVEDLHVEYANKFSIITSRAFARLDNFISSATPLLAKGGQLIAMKGDDVEGEIASSSDTLKKLGCAITAIHYYDLPCNMGKRSLVVIIPRKAA